MELKPLSNLADYQAALTAIEALCLQNPYWLSSLGLRDETYQRREDKGSH
jgi:hypothetical protein